MKKDRPNVVVYKYSTILSYVIERWIDDNQHNIVYNEGKYHIFSKVYKTKFILDVFHDHIEKFFEQAEHYGKVVTFVAGTCYAHHSWLEKYKDEMDENNKLRIVRERVPMRYIFSDRKFTVDEEQINAMFDQVLSNYITNKKKVFTPNHVRVKFMFIKNVPEDDLARIIKSQRAECKIYPSNRHNLIVDINKFVFKDIKGNHNIDEETKKQAVEIYRYMIKEDENA